MYHPINPTLISYVPPYISSFCSLSIYHPMYPTSDWVLSLSPSPQDENQNKIKIIGQNFYQNKSQTKQNETWNHGVCTDSWAWGPWCVINIPSDTLLVDTNFSFPSMYQFRIASWLWVELDVYYPFSVRGLCLIWICPGLPCVCCQSLWVHDTAVTSGRHCFLGVNHHIGLLHISLPPLLQSSEPWGQEFDKRIPFRTECCNLSSHFLHTAQLWGSVDSQLSREQAPPSYEGCVMLSSHCGDCGLLGAWEREVLQVGWVTKGWRWYRRKGWRGHSGFTPRGQVP